MQLTPMMQQYLDTKQDHPDEILFFRLGDFYEMFFDDAVLVSKELGLTLTSRGTDATKAPMCGVPFHAAEQYINKLILRGYKVAIAEQIGDPKAPGLTKREVIKVVTPGTVLSDSALNSTSNNYVALIFSAECEIILACADVSTGEFFYGIYKGEYMLQQTFDEIYRLSVSELLLAGDSNIKETVKEFVQFRLPRCLVTTISAEESCDYSLINKHFADFCSVENLNIKDAIATLLKYLHEMVKCDLSNINQISRIDNNVYLMLDNYTLRNLEITHNLRDNSKKNTLYDVMDFTKTAMGSRLLKKWLEHPLVSVVEINQRLDAVNELFKTPTLKNNLREACGNIFDFERIITRLELGSANARDLISLKISFMSLPLIKKLLKQADSKLLQKCNERISVYDELTDLIDKSIVDEPGISLRDGNIIKDGYNSELDEYRHIARDSKAMLQDIEEREKRETGIKSLKISYNKVFGYYIEVRNSNADLVPDHYIRKQTLANAERYITQELKEFETKILGAQEKIINLEYSIFNEVKEKVTEYLVSIQKTALNIAELDVLCSMAQTALEYNYVRPIVRVDGNIIIRDGRHPLVERIQKHDIFVPNDTDLNHDANEVILITGPNMAGKSTYMRQTALLTLMAQTGSFIPAREAFISPVDRIFTRIGASDDLVSGQSTFMVEMNEVAQILQHATRDSLIILDEIGRGTSTFDGMSIARAVVEYIRERIHAKTLFATHYHELTDLEDEHTKNYCVAVKEKGNKVLFLRRIIAGSADKSYGIHVARLAGLPTNVIKRAEAILKGLEGKKDTITEKKAFTKAVETLDKGMESLFKSRLSEELLTVDVMTMTPLEALNKLYKLQQQAKQEAGIL